MISAHPLPESAFTALAAGGGNPAVIRRLREAQRSKHTMLLYAVAEAAYDSAGPGPAAFRAGYELLTRIQAARPRASAWLFGLPHLGGWLHDCLIRLDQGSTADFGHFGCLAAAAAVRSGLPFDLDIPVRDGRAQLPGLGFLRVAEPSPWIRLRGDGARVTAGDDFTADRRLLVPDDGSGDTLRSWSGTPMVRAVAGKMAWSVLLETNDPYLDRYNLPMAAGLPADELQPWRDRIQSAWEVLTDHHRRAAGSVAAGTSVIVPLTPESDTDLISATSPAAFGAIATSWPPDPVILAETIVHEFQHVKLCGLLDMVPLTESGGEKVYAPWRQDPRPAAGLLQGVYAHLGIARFWQAQQYAETGPDDILRARVLFARWRPAIDLAADTLLETGCLTPAGARFVRLLREQGQQLTSVPADGDAEQIAAEAALDHRLTWQLRHLATDPAEVAGLAAAYQRGESLPGPARPRLWISEDARKVGSSVRSRLLTMRYLDPARYRELCADPVVPLGEPDRLLIGGNTAAAILGYRSQIAGTADPQPDAWIGLALALHRLPPSPLQPTFATYLALMSDVHARLGGRADPVNLASWFT